MMKSISVGQPRNAVPTWEDVQRPPFTRDRNPRFYNCIGRDEKPRRTQTGGEQWTDLFNHLFGMILESFGVNLKKLIG